MAKTSMFDDGTEHFRPEGGVIYGSNACHQYRRPYHRLRGLGRHESRSAQNALSRRGALAPRYFLKTSFYNEIVCRFSLHFVQSYDILENS